MTDTPIPPPTTPPPNTPPSSAPNAAADASDPWTPPAGELAEFWSRLGAHVLDGILYGLVTVPFVALGGAIMLSQTDCLATLDEDTCDFTGNPFIGFGGGTIMGLGFLLAAVLFVHALATSGRPWGARIVGLRVVNGAGQSLGWGGALLRTFVSWVGSSNSCSIGYLWMLGNPERQTWHDRIARSYVIRERGTATGAPTPAAVPRREHG